MGGQNINVSTEQNTATNGEPNAVTGADQQLSVTRTDWKAEARKWEDRAKSNRKEADELKAKADKWDDYQREGMTEAEKARERAEAAEAELAQLRAEAQRNADVMEAAEAAGIPVDVARMLNGTTADELKEQAARLLKLMPVHPTRTDDGGSGAAAQKSKADRFAEAMFGAI